MSSVFARSRGRLAGHGGDEPHAGAPRNAGPLRRNASRTECAVEHGQAGSVAAEEARWTSLFPARIRESPS
jgi:hypothetical protein